MNRRVIFLIIAVLLLQSTQITSAPAWSTYIHPTLGFSLSYPTTWVMGPKITGVEVIFVSPWEVASAGVRVNVNVTTETVPPGTSVAEYEDASEAQLKKLFHEYRRLRTDTAKAGSYEARLRYYTWRRNDGVELYQIQLVTVAKSRGYVVTGTTGTSSPDLKADADLLAQILLSFSPR